MFRNINKKPLFLIIRFAIGSTVTKALCTKLIFQERVKNLCLFKNHTK